MRKICSAFDVFEIVKVHKKEEYLYMTQEELFKKKLDADSEIAVWKQSVENTKDDCMQYFPKLSFMYSFYLIETAIISVIIDYKFTNLERLESKRYTKEYNPDITDLIITAIKENPKISYTDLIDLGTEKDEIEMYLERLIEDKVISRFGKQNNRYWKLKR